jgi:chromate transporter
MDDPIGAGRMKSRLGEIAIVFLRLGAIGFGGPAAHVALMEEELVRRRRWLDRQRFLDLLGATNLIPGPNSTEMAIHLGHERAGLPGLVVAGVLFIAPAAFSTLALAWAYVRFGARPEAGALLYGVKPVVSAIILSALLDLGRTAVKDRLTAAGGLVAFGLAIAGVDPITCLLAVGAAVATGERTGRGGLAALAFAAPATAAATLPGLAGLFVAFLRIGSVVFGSGYVLLAYLHADLVVARGWLGDPELLDAIAAGQLTPGPVFAAATFVGYLLGGVAGAAAATAGIFLPAFVLVAASRPLLARIRSSPLAGAFLDGVNAASLGLMAAVALPLAREALVDGFAIALGVAALAALRLRPINSAWLVLGGAGAGLARRLAGG